MKIYLLTFIFFTLVGCQINPKYSAKNADLENLHHQPAEKLRVAFSEKGVEDIVLISMVKNEEDIIFENLAWHYAIGFRKFILIENNSTDNTHNLIKKFAELTENHATVFIIQDPIFEYIQSRVMTGGYVFAKSVWPDLKWVFPVDADEFWIPERNLRDIIADIPANIEVVTVSASKYYPTKEYYKVPGDRTFYEKLAYREKELTLRMNKVAFRSTNKNITIAQGNHSIKPVFPLNSKQVFSKTKTYFTHASGNSYGLLMTEFNARSPEHIHRKLYNGMLANKAAQEKGYISKGSGFHWNSYAEDMEKHGKDASKVKFETSMEDLAKMVYNPLPLKEGIKFFYEHINNSVPSK